MYDTAFITDVLTAEIEREADYRGTAIAVDSGSLAEAVQRIEQVFGKFQPDARWSYEDREQAVSDKLVTLIDSAVTLYFA